MFFSGVILFAFNAKGVVLSFFNSKSMKKVRWLCSESKTTYIIMESPKKNKIEQENKLFLTTILFIMKILMVL